MCKHIETKMIPVDSIVVAERIRKDNGDLSQLADDISKHGLINPITVMNQDNGYLLIAGFRRLEATCLLNQSEILASVVSATDADEQLMLEIAENEQRKEFTLTERLTYAERLKAIEKEKGRQRMSIYARAGREDVKESISDYQGENHDAHEGTLERAYPAKKGESRREVAKKAGFSSHAAMERTAFLAENRPDLLARVEAGEVSLYAAYKEAMNDKKPETGKPIEEQTLREIQSRIVQAAPVERESVTMFNPMSVAVKGIKTSLKGADHEHLLDNPVYSALYSEYAKAVQTANSAYGRIFSTSEGYEKRIRGYEENIQAMRRTIEDLRAENERLRSKLEETVHA